MFDLGCSQSLFKVTSHSECFIVRSRIRELVGAKVENLHRLRPINFFGKELQTWDLLAGRFSVKMAILGHFNFFCENAQIGVKQLLGDELQV